MSQMMKALVTAGMDLNTTVFSASGLNVRATNGALACGAGVVVFGRTRDCGQIIGDWYMGVQPARYCT